MVRTWKQAGWRDMKAGKLSMKGMGFSLGEMGTRAEWSRVGIEKLTFGQTELPGTSKQELRSSWTSGFGFISVSGKITAENVMNYKVKREGKDREEHHQKVGTAVANTQRSRRKPVVPNQRPKEGSQWAAQATPRLL